MRIFPFSQNLAAMLDQNPETGRHRWLYRLSCSFRAHNIPKEHAETLIAEMAKNATRQVPAREYLASVACAYSDTKPEEQPKWPEEDSAAIRAAEKSEPFCDVEGEAIPASEAWDLLYGPGDLVCAAMDTARPAVLERDKLAPFDRWQFVVPSPMLDTEGVTTDGRPTKRSLDNAGPRKWLVVEFDGADWAQQTRRIAFLSELRQPSIIVHSGGKSLHTWFRVDDDTQVGVEWFFKVACLIGADPHMWTTCQWARAPGGKRPDGTVQRVVWAA